MLRQVSLMTSRANELPTQSANMASQNHPSNQSRELLLQQAGTPRVAYMPQHVYIFTPCREPWPAASINAPLGKVPVVGGGKYVMLPASRANHSSIRLSSMLSVSRGGSYMALNAKIDPNYFPISEAKALKHLLKLSQN